MTQRVLDIDGTLNFRDIGGYTSDDGRSVKWGKVYRSAQLNRLSDVGVTNLANLGIKTVVDLRFTEESNRAPTILAAVPQAEMLSWHDEQQTNASLDVSDKSGMMVRGWRESLESKDPAVVREAMRLNYPVKLYSHQAIYQKMLFRLIEDKSPLVFHCAAGKDRTGVAAALILSLLGVNEEQIIADYLLTQAEVQGRLDTWLAGGATNSADYKDFQNSLLEHPKELLQPVFDADVSYIKTALEYVNQTYGGFTLYAQQRLQLSNENIEQLKVALLE